jgi:hypothetical protein
MRVTWTARCCCTQCVHTWDRVTDDPPGTLLMVDCPKCRARSWEVLAVATRPDPAPVKPKAKVAA